MQSCAVDINEEVSGWAQEGMGEREEGAFEQSLHAPVPNPELFIVLGHELSTDSVQKHTEFDRIILCVLNLIIPLNFCLYVCISNF